MKELIKVSESVISANQVNTVDARELHDNLGSKREFAHWIKAKVLDNPFFMEGQDYVLLDNPVMQSGRGGHNRKDYALTIDTAKKVAMAEQTAAGDRVRDYFIECEAAAIQSQLPQNYIEALEAHLADRKKIATLEEQRELDRPKVELATAIEASSKSITIGEYVKVISNQEGFVVGRNKFFKWLRFERFLDNRNSPYQRYIDQGWFEVKEGTFEHKNTNGPQVCFTTVITGAGQVGVLNRFRKSNTYQKFLNKSAKANRKQKPLEATA